MAEALLPCPFCGHDAEFEREGTGRQSCIVTCTDCGARHESGDTWNSGHSWNRRTPSVPEEANPAHWLKRQIEASAALPNEKVVMLRYLEQLLSAKGA